MCATRKRAGQVAAGNVVTAGAGETCRAVRGYECSIFSLGVLYRVRCHVMLPLVGTGAGWSSLAARRAHNPKVVGSNPTPATK